MTPSRFLLAILIVSSAFLGTLTAAEPGKKPAPGEPVFGLTRIWDIHITMSPKEYETMQPAAGGFFGGAGFGGPKTPPKKPVADRPVEVHKGGSFGIEFPWARGDVTLGDKTYANVGLSYKGGGSYITATGKLKRNLKVDLDRHEADHRFHGLKAINLNGGAMDPSRLRESLAFAVFRDAGVPTPRTAFAEVSLTIPGKHERERLGTYTLIEQVDKTFLKSWFGDGSGLLLKPEVRIGIMRTPLTYEGDDWAAYNDALKPKDEPTKAQADRVIAFIKLVDRAPEEQFRKEVESFLDIDQFLRFLAATALVATTDSFFTGGHNAYIYLDPKTNKFVFIPWDMDLAFGSFFLLGSADQHANLSLTRPYAGEHKLVDRLLAMKEVSEQYQKILKEIASSAFTKEKVLANLDAIEKAIKEPLDREAKAVAARKEPAGFAFGFPQPPELRAWVAKRTTSVAEQLDGKSKGWVPAGFQFGQPAPARPGDVLAPADQDALRLTPDQRRQLRDMQLDVDSRLDKLLTEEQRRQLREMRERRPGQPPKRPAGPGKP